MPPANSNKLHLDEDGGRSYCWTCERWFHSANGARNHARQASIHADAWCEQCDRLFVSSQARNDHVANSSVHRSTNNSDEGYLTETASNETSEEDYGGYESEDDPYDLYYRQPNQAVRTSAARQNNVRQSYQYRRYEPQSVECYGCYEQFGTLSGSLMHLESGACESQVQLHEIDEWAFRGRDSVNYTNRWTDYDKYCCPTCDADFRLVSALVQHIELRSCRQRIEGSVRHMLEYVERKVLQSMR